MAPFEACLLDAYDTIIRTDYFPFRDELPALAGVPAEAMWKQFRELGPALSVGQLTMTEAFTKVLRACGADPRPDLIRQLTDRSRELLLSATRLYDDVLPFLRWARARGLRTAIVSNCDENTVGVLDTLGVTALVEAEALSFRVGVAKPAPKIYFEALGHLGVPAGSALFVDNSAVYCAGADDVGIHAAQMVRGAEPAGGAGQSGSAFPVVRSLADVQALIDAET